MAIEHLRVGVVVERREIDNPWADHTWKPLAVLPDAPDIPAWTLLHKEPGVAQYYAGAAYLSLYPSDTGNLIDNFVPGARRIWVSIRPTGMDPPLELIGVTAEPGEGEILADGIGDIVDTVPMPELVAERILAFYNAHHVERPFVKRQRDKGGRNAFNADRNARGPGGRRSGPDGEPQ